MDELIINTLFGKRMFKRLAEKFIKRKLKRKIDIDFENISMVHKENNTVDIRIHVVASMSEAELTALIEQIGGDK